MKEEAKEQSLKKRYIKDYVPNETGDLQYRGKYYLSKLSEEECRSEGLKQILFSIACLLMVFVALCIPSKGSQTIYIVIPLEITLVCLWVQLSGSMQLFKAEKRMEQKDYDKAYQSPVQALTVAIFLYIFSLGGQMITSFMNRAGQNRYDIYFGMDLIGILVISVVAWNRRRKLMHTVWEEQADKIGREAQS